MNLPISCVVASAEELVRQLEDHKVVVLSKGRIEMTSIKVLWIPAGCHNRPTLPYLLMPMHQQTTDMQRELRIGDINAPRLSAVTLFPY